MTRLLTRSALIIGIVSLIISSGLPGAYANGETDVVIMSCGYRGQSLEITEFDTSNNGNASSLGKGTSCAYSIGQLIDGGYSFANGSTGPNGAAPFAFMGVRRPLNPGEVTTLTNPGDVRDCTCEDSLPITGYTCQSCTSFANDNNRCQCRYISTP